MTPLTTRLTQALPDSDGHGTLRATVADIARQIAWPRGFTARIRRNAFTGRWHGREDELAQQVRTEAAGVIDAIEPAGVIVERMVQQAAARRQPAGRQPAMPAATAAC